MDGSKRGDILGAVTGVSTAAVMRTVEVFLKMGSSPMGTMLNLLRIPIIVLTVRPPGDPAPSVIREPAFEQEAGKCPELEILAAYVDGKLAADEQESTERHLARCVECRKTIAMAVNTAG